jgi:hypothetical protein
MKRYISLLFLLLLVGCSVKAPHPNAVDKLDGTTYDILTVAQSVLDNAKIDFAQGKLPSTSKPVINGMGLAYNELRDLWLDYHASPDATKVDRILAATNSINNFILQLRKLGVK